MAIRLVDWSKFVLVVLVGVVVISYFYHLRGNPKLHPATPRATQHAHQQYFVPKVVHVLWFYPEGTSLRFHQFISLLSVHKFLQPDEIVVWNSHAPEGPWWNAFLLRSPPVTLRHLDPPETVFDRPINITEHKADVARIQVLLRHGGIYLDLDVIILRSFDSLLKHDVTMGAESPDLLGSGLILSKADSTFLKLWLETYRNFTDGDWNRFSVRKPMEIAKAHPDLLHIEWFGFHRPNWFEREWIYSTGLLWDWSENFAMHLWYRTHDTEYEPESIRKLNSTLGEVFRFVFYGSGNIT
ncbi:hypothetical protein CAPTEDRAFT_219581 [Capitella teleta]|uniref:Alpha-1,4-N-acetylglucosaminyltransferase n=1 Tax=Capitella teleta TaxID=283909 RepID=R7UCM2_CAPTE|nr:hypothetical protein CAPTEDRAFT_219581 [Capitella teleta]|eukprot:ELU04130.1 hypothetical protein CAPTEDRAFT_219581 [Capitella teleta]